MEWNEELSNFEDRIITQMLKRVYCKNKRVKWDDPAMSDCIKNYKNGDEFRWKLIKTCLVGDQLGKLNAKILHCICILLGVDEAAQIFARFMYSARDEKQFINFLSFALTVLPHLLQTQPQSAISPMTMAVKYAILEWKKIEKEMNKHLFDYATNPLERHLMRNLLMLVRWQEQSQSGIQLRHIGLNLSDIGGHLNVGLLDWALNYVDLVKKHNGGILCNASSFVLNTFYSLMMAVYPQERLSLSFQHNLFAKISAYIVSTLMFVQKEKLGTNLDGVDIFARACAISGKLFLHQAGADPAQLLRSLLDEAFGNYSQLFSFEWESKDEFSLRQTSREVGTNLDYSKFKKIDYLNVDANLENSMFNELRQMSLEPKSAAAVAHTGTLRRKRPALQSLDYPTKLGEMRNECKIEPTQIRRLLFMDFVEFLCLNGKHRQSISTSPNAADEIYNLRLCNFLGQMLVDHFAGDGLTSHSAWFSWEQERELISQYIEVTKLLNKYSIVMDFLLILSDVGFRGLCYVLPLIKAFFVVILGQLENTSQKTEKISIINLQKFTQILALLISADYFPKILTIFHQMMAKLNNHEAFVMMRDLWDFLKSTIPPVEELNHQKKIILDNSQLKTKEGSQLISTMVIVIQRNITTLGQFMPNLIALTGEKNENDWSIGREIRPISVIAEIKR